MKKLLSVFGASLIALSFVAGCAHQKPKPLTLDQVRDGFDKLGQAVAKAVQDKKPIVDEGTFGDSSHLHPSTRPMPSRRPKAPARALPRPTLQGSYTVAQGDTLWDIAAAKTSSPFNWPGIWRSNRDQVLNPDLILAGTTLHWDSARVENPVYRRMAYRTRPFKPTLKK
jgi:nucleoid-associated protein YgaU